MCCLDMEGSNDIYCNLSSKMFAENRQRLCRRLRGMTTVPKSSLIVLQAAERVRIYDTLEHYEFRQDQSFFWAFGIEQSGCLGVIQVRTGLSLLFVPRRSAHDSVELGIQPALEEIRDRHLVEEVHSASDIEAVLREFQPHLILTLPGAVLPTQFAVDFKLLGAELVSCRIVKTPHEVQVLRHVNRVANDALRHVMHRVRPGLKEQQLDAMWAQFVCFLGGCRARNLSPTDGVVQAGELYLFRVESSYCGYDCEVVCSIPVSGFFSDEQAAVYGAVLAARDAVLAAAGPDVSWLSLHLEAQRALLGALAALGLLQGNLDKMLASGVGTVFMPHVLGRFVDTDIRDYVQPKSYTSLILEEGMVLTIELGCCFVDALLNEALAHPEQSQYLVEDAIERFRGFGGARTGDNVLVTDKGVENLTVLPRTVQEIEQLMNWRSLSEPRVNTNYFRIRE